MSNDMPKPVFKAPLPPSTGTGAPKAAAPQMPTYRPVQTPGTGTPQTTKTGSPQMPAGGRPTPAQPTQPIHSAPRPSSYTGVSAQPTPGPTTSTQGLYDDNFAAQFNLPPVLLTTKVMGAIMAGIFLFGILFGATVFGGTTQTTTSGLQGVVRNPEVPAGRKRCGIAERTQGCVLFMMNASRRDREARSFYDEAARITGVPSYTIELGNIEYATSIIRPGFLAQINIPPTNR